MKANSIILTAAILAAFSLTGCGGQRTGADGAAQALDAADGGEEGKEAQAVENEAGPEEIETAENTENADSISIRFEESKQDFEAEDGTVLLTVENVWPVVDIPSNPKAAEAINEYVKSPDIQGMSAEEVLTFAREEYEERGSENWYGYSMGSTFSEQRADNVIISLTADIYSYMGGAHPNAVRGGFNFNPQTGSQLKLEDVVTDRKAAAEAVKAYILNSIAEDLEKEENQGMYFEDYEENADQLLTDATWYLSGQGFHIIGNEYIISPHAAGILDFLIPYGQADFLKSEYRQY